MTTGTATVLMVYAAGADDVWRKTLELKPGMTVQQAVESSGFEQQHPNVQWKECGVGIFGKKAKPRDIVRAGDRIEIYRELIFDPKESRRRRALHRQRQKQTGEKRRGRQRTV